MKRFIFLLGLGVLGALLVRSFCFEGIFIASDSMAPTLPKGTHIMANKLTYLFRKPERGEIIMFETPQKPDRGLVKRVIGIGGDVVAIQNKRVYINDVLLEEPYVQYLRPKELLKGDHMNPLLIPNEHVFVLVDNRGFSEDSRDYMTPEGVWSPYVSLSSIKGKIHVSLR